MPTKPKRKWHHLVGVVPSIEPIDDATPERLEMLDALKQEIIEEYRKEHGAPPTTQYLVEEYFAMRDAKDLIKEQLKGAELQLNALTSLLAEQYRAEGRDNYTLVDDGQVVGRVEMHPEPYVVVKDRDANREWAIMHGFERSLQLHWKTLLSEVKRQLDTGEAVYDGEKLVGGPDGIDLFVVQKFKKVEAK
jgi:hypothetical protein